MLRQGAAGFPPSGKTLLFGCKCAKQPLQKDEPCLHIAICFPTARQLIPGESAVVHVVIEAIVCSYLLDFIKLQKTSPVIYFYLAEVAPPF